MPKVHNLPPALRAFTFHGLDLSAAAGADQRVTDCPLCGKGGKWYADEVTGKWCCKSCGASGNPTTFLRQLWEAAEQQNEAAAYALAGERGLLYAQTLDEWGLRLSPISGEWLLPAFNSDGALINLYRYCRVTENGKQRMVLMSTTGQPHGLFGPLDGDGARVFDARKPEVHCYEGPWDGMAAYEVLRQVKRTEGGDPGKVELEPTGNEVSSLYSQVNVVAVPGCNVWTDGWGKVTAGKVVTLFYDNDHPKLHPQTGAQVGLQGYRGVKRVVELLGCCPEPPALVRYLQWGADGYDRHLPSGYDVRDCLRAARRDNVTVVPERVALYAGLLSRVVPIPPTWLPGRTAEARAAGSLELEPLPCTSWHELTTAWRKALKWTGGLDRTLVFMLAACASTGHVGDQIWGKVMGRPSSGKTTLCEALNVSRQYVYSKDTLTGLISGYQSDATGTRNLSMVEKLRGKTLIINDGDTLLRLPNLGQIMSHLRAFYGRNIRSQYGNEMSHNHEGISTTVLLCGTNSLEALDHSELGERFLNCYIMDEVDPDHERDVARKSTGQILANLGTMVNGTADSMDTPDRIRAKRLTGGYLNYLRANSSLLLSKVLVTEEAHERLLDYGLFVAHVRARPVKGRREESVVMEEREFCVRLCNQLVLLAPCLAVVTGKREVDGEVMARVRKVALDTGRGLTVAVAKILYESGGIGYTTLAAHLYLPDEAMKKYLQFLRKIDVVFLDKTGKDAEGRVRGPGAPAPRPVWKLTDRMRHLYERVVLDQ